ncbi:hypothetical protein [Bradyrhizobium betae]|uniref:hypothetical protein n=1 Tax=Bradyrhizobium betae TaxID=244734 RepID=UPI0013E936FA|nr:hypothetical protein [Bradyrhizobium betae]
MLLYTADRYFPLASDAPSVAEVDKNIIRIASNRPLPEKIVFDVSHSPVPAPPAAVDVEHDERSPRESDSQNALAMMPQDRPAETRPIAARSERRARHQRAVHSRTAHRIFERRVALDHRELFGSW